MTRQEYKDIYDVVGAAMEVHRTLGRGMEFYYNGIIVELKSVAEIVSDHRAQLFNYMRITGMHRGILINFGERFLRAERYLYLPEEDDFVLLQQDNYKDYITDN